MGFLILTLKQFSGPEDALELVKMDHKDPKQHQAIVKIDAVGLYIANVYLIIGYSNSGKL